MSIHWLMGNSSARMGKFRGFELDWKAYYSINITVFSIVGLIKPHHWTLSLIDLSRLAHHGD